MNIDTYILHLVKIKKLQGKVNIENATIEDFVILRKDGTPTYNLSAAADSEASNTKVTSDQFPEGNQVAGSFI